MAKRAKRSAQVRKTAKRAKVGRPKGSKNTRSDKGLVRQFQNLAFEAQAEALEQMNRAFLSARESRAAQLLGELKRLGIKAGESAGQIFSKSRQSKLAGRKAEPKYRSKNDPSLTWAGRGQMPRWMRDEMKGTKLKKEDFAI